MFIRPLGIRFKHRTWPGAVDHTGDAALHIQAHIGVERCAADGNRLAEDLFFDRRSRETRAFPPDLIGVARRKVLYLHDAAELDDLRVPPGNRLELLKGRWKGYHSIRINDQWRLVFRWEQGHAQDVTVVDYH